MTFLITARHGTRRQRYHIFTIEAPDIVHALELAARAIPRGFVPEMDLVEVRIGSEREE